MTALPPPSKFSRAWQFTRRWLGRTCLAFLLCYSGFLLLGCVPVNRFSYQLPPTDDQVVIYLRNNEIHSDFVVPVTNERTGRDWRTLFPPQDFKGDVSSQEYVAIGWGNRDFFINTPTWSEFKLSSALRGLFTPSESVLHVEYVPKAVAEAEYSKVLITHQQYLQLVQFVDDTLGKRDEQGHVLPVSNRTHGNTDRFYESRGTYHMFNTCNQWTGRGLKRAGVPTGLWTPLQQQVLIWLPTIPDEKRTGD